MIMPPSTTKSHWGTINLFGSALLNRNVLEMERYCTGFAVNECQRIIDEIAYMETNNLTSGLSYIENKSGAPGETITSVRMKLIGEASDLFMYVDMNLKRDEQNRFVIFELLGTPLREVEEEKTPEQMRLDWRAMRAALEEYHVDWNTYPPTIYHLTTPTSYIPNLMKDPFAPREMLHYTSEYNFWLLWSIGPDKDDDQALIIYDSTNGTISNGDVVQTGP